jgi:hypothetical protein
MLSSTGFVVLQRDPTKYVRGGEFAQAADAKALMSEG